MNQMAPGFARVFCAFTLAFSISMKAMPAAAPPESPESFLQRMGPSLEHEALVTKINDELKTIPLRKFEMRETTFREGAEYFNKLIRDHNSKPGIFQIPPVRFFELPADHTEAVPPAATAVQPGMPDNSSSESKQAIPIADGRFTLSLSSATLREAIQYVGDLSGTIVDIEPDAIWLKPKSAGVSALEKRVYIVPPSVCSRKEDVERIFGTSIRYYDSKTGRTYWDFDERSHLLTLQYGDRFFPEFELRYARELLKHGFRASAAPSK